MSKKDNVDIMTGLPFKDKYLDNGEVSLHGKHEKGQVYPTGFAKFVSELGLYAPPSKSKAKS